MPRVKKVILHRNTIASLFVSCFAYWICYCLAWLPALKVVAVKDLVTGVLAFSALGFGVISTATVAVLSVPRGEFYYTAIVNGAGAPRVRVTMSNGEFQALVVDGKAGQGIPHFGPNFRSVYSDLVFLFFWTMVAQIVMAIGSVAYLAIAGDLNIVDTGCRSTVGFLIMAVTVSYAMLQMGSLVKGFADYIGDVERFDRVALRRQCG